MTSKYPRATFAAAVLVAFVCGLVFASGFDLTRFGWAQSKVGPKPTAQQVAPLAESQNAFEAIADHVTPAVVSIQTERLARSRGNTRLRGQMPPGFDEFFHQFEMPQSDQPQEASGSGFIVTKDGYILTNNHVVADADRVKVTLLDNRSFPAKVIGRDPTTDVAVIKIDGAGDLPVASIGDDSKARVGQWVVAIGNPLGLNFTVTAGIVSAKGRTLQGLLNSPYAIQDYIQTDAAINPGNSGGPLVNIRGEVVGINSAIASSTGYYAGYGFAIPITLAKEVMDDLIQYGHVRRAVLGININDVTPEDAQVAGLKQISGVKVGGFTPADDPEQSPAKRAGLEAGDIIVALNGTPVDHVSTLQRIVRGFKPGDVVSVDVQRFGDRKQFRVKLAAPPADNPDVASANGGGGEPAADQGGKTGDRLGIRVSPVSADLAARLRVGDEFRRGLLVTDVAPSGPAYHELFENQDVIERVLYPTKRDVRSASDLEQALSGLKKGDLVTLLVYDVRAKGTRVVTMRVGG